MRIVTLALIAILANPFPAAANWKTKNAVEPTRQDILRGTITPERAWWDLMHYHLSINVDPKTKSISGTNTMKYKVLSAQKRIQIELQEPLVLEKVVQNGQQLKFIKDGYSYFIDGVKNQQVGQEYELTMHYSGVPQEAERAPWDGGISWKKDEKGTDFIASSCQDLGASVWWPNKDHAYDEPDNGVMMSVEVPEHLMNVSNGRLVKVDKNPERKTKTFHWRVVNPINNYGVNINIGDYVHFGEKFAGEKGELDMDYYVIRENLAKAKKQFKDAKKTIAAFEHWFGPYPFYEDSFKLVEAPYLGMEHQSSVTYGNGYQNGYRGTDRSGAGPGMLFDFIIVHEAGHEWFANNITHVDIADLWIHESFTNYSESLFLEYHYDKETAFKYIRGQRKNIQNQATIIGIYDQHKRGSGDMYDKGGNMLHTMRQIVDNDNVWRDMLRGMNKDFYHKSVTSVQVESYINEKTGKDFSKVFDQYLRDTRIPTFEYHLTDEKLLVRWANVVEGFDMPVKVALDGEEQWLSPTTKWTEVALNEKKSSVKVDANFYVNTLSLLGN